MLGVTKYLLFAALTVAPGVAQVFPQKNVDLPFDGSPRLPRARWVHGYLPTYLRPMDGKRPAVSMVDKSGATVIPETEIWRQDASLVEIHAVTADAAGRLFAAVEVKGLNGEVTGFVYRVEDGGKTMSFTATGGFIPRALAATRSGEVWAFGTPAELRTQRQTKMEYETLWRFDAAGQVAEKLLPRSTFGDDVIPAHNLGAGAPFMWATSSRVGVFSSTAGRWVEYDVETHQKVVDIRPEGLKAQDGRAPILGELAMTDSDNEVYAFWAYPSQDANALYRLNRSKGVWEKVTPQTKEYRGFFGADGDALIFRAGTKNYGWFPVSGLVSASGSVQ